MARQSRAVHSFRNGGMSGKNGNYAAIQTEYDPRQEYICHDYSPQNFRSEPRPTYNYKPTALRSWFLIGVATFLIACVATTEYAIRSAPSAADVYNNTTLTARDDHIILVNEGPGPISQNRRLSPKGMPRMERDETAVLHHRVPSSPGYFSLGPSPLSDHASGSGSPSYRPTTVSSLKTTTSDGLTTITVSYTASPTSSPVSSSRSPVGTVVTIPKETSETAKHLSAPAHTTTSISSSATVIPEVVSTSTEQRRDPSGHQTTLIHVTTLRSATTSYVVIEPTPVSNGQPADTPEAPSPILTTFTSTLPFGDTTSATIIIPEIITVSTEETEDSAGVKTTMFHTWTLQTARTTTQLSLDSTPAAEDRPLTTVITSTIGYMTPSPRTTLIKETMTIAGTTTRVLETTTDSLGKDIAIYAESTIPAQTITRQEVVTLVNTKPPRTTLIKETITIVSTTAKVLQTTTDSLGNDITTLIDSTIPAQTITTQEVSTLSDDDTSQTTLVKETITLAGTIVKVPETTTDSLGNIITTLIDNTIPAQTFTRLVISTLHNGDTAEPTFLGIETQQQRLLASSAPLPTFRVLVSTVHYTTVIPTSIPTVAPVPPNGINGPEFEVLGLNAAEYFSGEFLPTILAVIASLLLEVIGNNAKRMQPFFTLAASTTGATARSTIFFRLDKWFGAMAISQAIRLKQPLIIITQTIVIGSQIIAPLSAEAVQIYTPMSCTASCSGKIAVQRPVARALEGLMGATAVLLVIIVILTNLDSYKTGVNHNPWSFAGMASLCGHPDVRTMLARIPQRIERPVDEEIIAKMLAGQRYMLGTRSQTSRKGEMSYGLMLAPSGDEDQNHELLLRETEQNPQPKFNGSAFTKVSPWLRPLTWWFRLAFLGLIAIVLIIVAYYEETTRDSGFENFMDSRGFGVRFLFTGLGVLIGGLMGAVFECRS